MSDEFLSRFAHAVSGIHSGRVYEAGGEKYDVDEVREHGMDPDDFIFCNVLGHHYLPSELLELLRQ